MPITNRFLRPSRAILLAISVLVLAHVQKIQSGDQAAQTFALTDTHDLVVSGGKAEAIEYQGRRAVRLTGKTTELNDVNVFAFVTGTQFQDGAIEADLAAKVTTRAGVRNPGFVGIAFRARTDASNYELFYLRPRNSHSEDQAMRNHSVQYAALAGFPWYKLRRAWPSVYESYADLRPEAWIHVKIEVHGRTATLYLNGSENPSLIVDGMKGEDLRGGVALWAASGEEAYFSDLRITPAKTEAVENGGEAAETWEVNFDSDAGSFGGAMELHREGKLLTGTWSGAFGRNQPVTGTWRNGYVELTFDGTWPGRESAPVKATLAGWMDGDSAKGRMKVEGRADGEWTAARKK